MYRPQIEVTAGISWHSLLLGLEQWVSLAANRHAGFSWFCALDVERLRKAANTIERGLIERGKGE